MERILGKAEPKLLPEETRKELEALILADGKRYGLEKLPEER